MRIKTNGQKQMVKNTKQQLERITDLFFEAGMLRFTPRSGWPFLGAGEEDVAEHSFRVALMSFVLAHIGGADPFRAAALGLFHDLHEARTSDLNYVNQRYVSPDKRKAQQDAVAQTGLDKEILTFFDEFESSSSQEAKLAKDADQLDLIFNLKTELDKGCHFAMKWLDSAIRRLRTSEAKAIAATMLKVDHNRWWYGRVDKKWWINRTTSAQTQKEEHVRTQRCCPAWRPSTNNKPLLSRLHRCKKRKCPYLPKLQNKLAG